MVLRSIQSDIKTPSIEMLPDSLKVLLDKIKQQHYEELYESEADGTTSLQDDLNENILKTLPASEQDAIV
ncbi:hypothetical protein ACE1CI_13250 [Aerosakkonemataceae cyanobacterium BLCC-F50]|uniref:Uncharacterized protein n=1 Tax=Floridaenema flaviceps BLCC-F50 TaxID=3153642 RepID=A0ABV4XQB3_9CYAN